MRASQLKIALPHYYFGNRRDHKSQQIKPRWEHLFIRSLLERRRKMAHLLSFTDTRPPSRPPEHLPEPSSPPRNINDSSKKALLVENDSSLLHVLRRSLTDEGYAVRTAENSEEGLRLYRDCAPFNVVLINYLVPQDKTTQIDVLAELQTNGTALATAIREINPSQTIIIAALDYRNAGEVPRPWELMHLPILINICKLRGLLKKIEVDRAIEALTLSELQRLQQFADFRVRGLGRAARGRTGEDLLGEALLRTLIGAEATRKGRHWNKNVDFVWHLAAAMRSISSSWRRQFEAAAQRKETEAYLIPALPIYDAEGLEHSPLDNLTSGDTTVDQRLMEKEEEDRVLTIFNGDADATQVLHGLLDSLKKNEIMSKYGLGEKQYAAAVRRIRVTLLGRRNGGSGDEKHDR
jgi:CheY-like chemotaxis protein